MSRRKETQQYSMKLKTSPRHELTPLPPVEQQTRALKALFVFQWV